MSLSQFPIRYLLFSCLLVISSYVHAQDTTLSLAHNSFNQENHKGYLVPEIIKLDQGAMYIAHSPDKEDQQTYKTYKQLIGQTPTAKNYQPYYKLACSLWELNKIAEARLLCKTVLHSTAPFYEATYYHSSDVPGDTTTNVYGYGSNTSSYKNGAALILTKICIEKKQFDSALMYLNEAVNTYKVSYHCGTGHRWQENEYQYLYARCYDGLGRYEDVLHLLLPSSLATYYELVGTAIEKLYSADEISRNLAEAEANMVVSLDSLPSYSYSDIYEKGKFVRSDTAWYYSGSASVRLFNTVISIPSPDLSNGEHATREQFLELFKGSSLYRELNRKESSINP